MKDHTKGPWKAKPSKWTTPTYSADDTIEMPSGVYTQKTFLVHAGEHPDGNGICHVFNWQGQMEANAQLIAAAPQLLAVARNMLAALDMMPDDVGSLSMFNVTTTGKPTKAAIAIREGLRADLLAAIKYAAE